MHTCFICLRSNYHRDINLSFARKQLKGLFPGIRFSEVIETKPLYFRNKALFSNQVAVFETELSQAVILEELKIIEHVASKLQVDKIEERVILDADLLSFDNIILKPEDMEKDYVIEGMRQLKEQ